MAARRRPHREESGQPGIRVPKIAEAVELHRPLHACCGWLCGLKGRTRRKEKKNYFFFFFAAFFAFFFAAFLAT